MSVHAAGAGYVRRIRVSGSGYGKALYLNMEDGRTAVYAHLEEFAPKIRSVVEEIQGRQGRYRIDHIMDAESLRVDAGELIAYSGDSGAGPAHLHFEIREGERQVNPLLLGVSAHDSSPPRVRSVVFIPLGPHSMVDGRNRPLALGLRWDRGRGVYSTSRTPSIEGDVALACRIYDLVDGKPNRLAPHRVEMRVDGETEYEVGFDSVSLSSTQQVELVYNFDYARRGARNVLNLFCAPGRMVGLSVEETPLRGVLSVEGGGTLGGRRLRSGRHGLEILAIDFNGNKRAARLDFIANNRPALVSVGFREDEGTVAVRALDPEGGRVVVVLERSSDGGATWREVGRRDSTGAFSGKFEVAALSGGDVVKISALDEWKCASEPVYLGPGLCDGGGLKGDIDVVPRVGYAEITWVLDCAAAEEPQMWIVDPEAAVQVRTLGAERTGPASFRATVDIGDSLGPSASVMVRANGAGRGGVARRPLGVAVIEAGRADTTLLPGGAVLVLSEGTFVEDALIVAGVEDSFEVGALGELVPVSPPYRLNPPTQYFDGSGELFLPATGPRADSKRVGLYRKVGEDSWRWVGGVRGEGGRTVGGEVSHFSVYALMEDIEAPRVTLRRPRDGARLWTSRPLLDARIRDKGSGIDWDRVYFTIDGKKVVTAWEAETSHAWARPRYALSPGRHRIEITASDRAGNWTLVGSDIVIER